MTFWGLGFGPRRVDQTFLDFVGMKWIKDEVMAATPKRIGVFLAARVAEAWHGFVICFSGTMPAWTSGDCLGRTWAESA